MAVASSGLPTLYQYYTSSGITAGLSDQQPHFTLNNKEITIYSGSLHYFRVPRAYWRKRIRQMKAAGLNTVETYVPWNLHEPHSGVYDFGSGGSDFEDFLHVEEFLKAVQDEDMFALVRPGPYICSEWEFGGLPSWLLRNTSSVRNSKDKNYLSYVKRYFNILLPLLALLQFQNGGPIIGFQVENEYGNTFNVDKQYLEIIKQMHLDNGIKELLFTSDSPLTSFGRGSTPGVLQTANYNNVPFLQLAALKLMQPDKPLMTMEYWSGWYDYWLGNHNTGSVDTFRSNVEQILKFPSSINFYMFVGGTNFGFTNGANTLFPSKINAGLLPITTSYDYGAPITEFGNYTEKYQIVKEFISLYNKINVTIPEQPDATELVQYASLMPAGQILLADVLNNSNETIKSKDIIPMELLPINYNSGQSFGYITYRKTNLTIKAEAFLEIKGFVRDTVLVLLNGKLISPVPKSTWDIFGFGFWRSINSKLKLTNVDLQGATLDLVVENFGRNDVGLLSMFEQFKGLTEDVLINDDKITNWEIIPLEFKKSWNIGLTGWHSIVSKAATPALYKFVLNIPTTAKDTYIDMRNWNKGIVIVNGFVLGRYFFLGPQQALYLPAPFLRNGDNDIIVFEHYDATSQLSFTDGPIFDS